MGNELVALGAAFVAAALLARLGRRVEIPTIPLFMIAGILFGPHTPGIALVKDPGELQLLAVLGLILLLFHLGLEFSLDDLVAGGSRLLTTTRPYVPSTSARESRTAVHRSPLLRYISPIRWARTSVSVCVRKTWPSRSNFVLMAL